MSEPVITRVATIDPGLDQTAIAIWHRPHNHRQVLHLEERALWLFDTESFKTSSGDPLTERLLVLADRTARILEEHRVDTAILEIPTTGAAYWGRRKKWRKDERVEQEQSLNANAISKLFAAIGAVVAGCGSSRPHVDLEERPPLRLGQLIYRDETYEQGRRRIVLQALTASAKQAFATNDDLRSAIAMGLFGEL